MGTWNLHAHRYRSPLNGFYIVNEMHLVNKE